MIDFRDQDARTTGAELLAPEPELVQRIRDGLLRLRQQRADGRAAPETMNTMHSTSRDTE